MSLPSPQLLSQTSMLAQRALRVTRCSCGVLRTARGFSTETPSSSSAPESSSSTSSSSPSAAAPPASNQDLDSLWERVIRTPAAALSDDPSPSAPRRQDRHARGSGAGERRPKRGRNEGPTHAEKARFNDSLRRIFQDLERSHFGPNRVAASWEAMTRMPNARLRKEEESEELHTRVDALVEDLATQRAPADVLAWAEANVFRREQRPAPSALAASEAGADGSETPAAVADGGLAWPKTYPKALGALIAHLRQMDQPNLALAMFEHAKKLGVESYIAGCQTSAYNELIRVRWESFRDLKGVAAAVKEMEGAAVAWDRFTNRVVEDVVQQVGKELLTKPDAWGPDAYEVLASLEKSIAHDHQVQQKVFQRGTFLRDGRDRARGRPSHHQQPRQQYRREEWEGY